MELFIDTETSGMVQWKLPPDHKSQPWMVQLGAILSDKDDIHAELNVIISPYDRKISEEATEVHGITEKIAGEIGVNEINVMNILVELMESADRIVCHNVRFDLLIIIGSLIRINCDIDVADTPTFCTMLEGTKLCKLPGKFGNFKWPTLQELHTHLFGKAFPSAHDAMADVRACRRCYYRMKEL
ncbi:3'-5' exonuclease [Candidatus Pacearchaeota archaeon]|nr:3'-5' exonuclease [Candidatus Pacearchaeota archaeon]